MKNSRSGFCEILNFDFSVHHVDQAWRFDKLSIGAEAQLSVRIGSKDICFAVVADQNGMVIAGRDVGDLHSFGKDDSFGIENSRWRGITKAAFLVGLNAPRVDLAKRVEADSVELGETGMDDDSVLRQLDDV